MKLILKFAVEKLDKFIFQTIIPEFFEGFFRKVMIEKRILFRFKMLYISEKKTHFSINKNKEKNEKYKKLVKC